jgi:hypothetical protein
MVILFYVINIRDASLTENHKTVTLWRTYHRKTQCCGFGSASNKKQDPDPHQSDKLDLDPHQFADDKQTVWTMNLFEHFFKGLSLYLEARTWILIRIRIRVKSRIQIRIKQKAKFGSALGR